MMVSSWEMHREVSEHTGEAHSYPALRLQEQFLAKVKTELSPAGQKDLASQGGGESSVPGLQKCVGTSKKSDVWAKELEVLRDQEFSAGWTKWADMELLRATVARS